jgi:hypothetical protein
MEGASAVRVKGMHERDEGGVSMAWGTEYVPDRATVVANGSGRLCLKDVKRITEEAAHLLQENKASRLLVDCSDAILDMKVVDIFYLPECYKEIGMSRGTRIALILPKTRQPSGMYEFYETVCRNNGYMCSLFGSQQSAEQWLHEVATAR